MIVSSDDTEEPEPSWNPEGDDLSFLRDEGLELLALFKSIRDKEKRRVIFELVRLVAGKNDHR